MPSASRKTGTSSVVRSLSTPRAASFGATKVKGLRILWDAHVQDDGTVVLSALVVERGSRRQVRLRVGPAGMTRLP